MDDIYGEFGTPKYATANCIYDGLCEVADGEEMSMIGEMFPDVSYETQHFYYADKGAELKRTFEHMSDWLNKLWHMDLAMFQLDHGGYDVYGEADKGLSEIHDLIFQAMGNSDMAKRLGLKKLFADNFLRGDNQTYDEVREAWFEELQELDRFDRNDMGGTFGNVMKERGTVLIVSPYYSYDSFASEFYKKVMGLRLEKEIQFLAGCRAFLFSYDDFILGLRMNQHLYRTLEQQFHDRFALLNASYNERVGRLCAIAEAQGIALPQIESFALPAANI